MSLLDDLRAAAAHVDPQFQPSSNETAPLLGALIAYSEHGDSFLKAGGAEDDPRGKVTGLLAGQPESGQGDKTADTDPPDQPPRGDRDPDRPAPTAGKPGKPDRAA